MKTFAVTVKAGKRKRTLFVTADEASFTSSGVLTFMNRIEQRWDRIEHFAPGYWLRVREYLKAKEGK